MTGMRALALLGWRMSYRDLIAPNPRMSLTARSVDAPLKRVLVWMIDFKFVFVGVHSRCGACPAKRA